MKKKGAKKKRKPVRGRRATKVIKLSRTGPRSRPKLSRGRKDRVKWNNTDSVRLKIKFSTWPFSGRKRTLSVAAGGPSATLTVKPTARKGKHRYAVIAPKTVPVRRGPPDPPGVSVGD